MEVDNRKYAYKGTEKDMKCRDVQFEIGKTYYLDNDDRVQLLPENSTVLSVNKTVQTCTKKGIHYCNELKNVFSFYSDNGENRFFKVEIIGDFVDDKDGKSATRCMRFVEEIPQSEIKEMADKRVKEQLDKSMCIDRVKTLQILNPNLIVGGSIALYLHGVKLKRFGRNSVDYDFCLPYFQILQGNDEVKVGKSIKEQDWDEDDDENDTYSSDFETVVTVNGIKADIRVDPKQRYEIVNYDGFDFKVTPLLRIIEAKVKYAKTKWGTKHKNDLIEMLLNK